MQPWWETQREEMLFSSHPSIPSRKSLPVVISRININVNLPQWKYKFVFILFSIVLSAKMIVVVAGWAFKTCTRAAVLLLLLKHESFSWSNYMATQWRCTLIKKSNATALCILWIEIVSAWCLNNHRASVRKTN